MVNELHKFHLADYIIFGTTMIISVGIGIFYACSGGRQKTTSEYLVGGRKMKFLPVAISLLVSFESSIMMLGVPAEAYVYGIQWWICTWGYLCSQLLSIIMVVPLIHPLKLTSIFEYLELRYNSWHVRLVGTCLGLLSMLWYMGIVLFGPGIALEAGYRLCLSHGTVFPMKADLKHFIVECLSCKSKQEGNFLRFSKRWGIEFGSFSDGVDFLGCYCGNNNINNILDLIAVAPITGFPQWASISSVAIAAVIYTSIGGIKAVIWTDVFQSLVMFSGMAAILIKGTIDSGGPKQVWDNAMAGGRFNLFNFDLDVTVRHTFWSLFFGSFLRGMGFSFNQPTCQRISSIETKKGAYKVMFVTSPLFFLTISLAVYEGIVAFSYYTSIGCDPLASKQISDPNQVIPYMVMDIFRYLPGMPGLFIASLFSASLSTLSTGLSSISAIFLQDIVKKLYPKDLSEAKSTVIAKVSVLISGVLAFGIALLIAQIGGTLIQITGTVLSAFGGPLAGLFLLSSLCPWANKKGALISTILGLALCTWLGMGSSFSKSLKKTPWLPPASTEFCDINNNTFIENSTSSSLLFNYTTTTSIDDIITTSTMQQEPQGLDKMYSLSYMWFSAVGVGTVLIMGTIISFLTGIEEVESKYIVPGYFSFISCLPKPIEKVLRFRVVDSKDDVKNTADKIRVDNMEFSVPADRGNGFFMNGEELTTLLDNRKSENGS